MSRGDAHALLWLPSGPAHLRDVVDAFSKLDGSFGLVRRFLVASSLALAALAAGAGLQVDAAGASQSPSEGAIVDLTMPGALAVSSTGVLYVVDSSRDQILRRVTSGRFQVVAGTGRRGFSGDGHLAIDAEISVTRWGGLAVARNGTVYFADEGNERIREILPDGVIETVAGGGTESLGTVPVTALRVRFGNVYSLNGLAIGPGGQLYIASNGVYRLANGVLHWVVGSDAPGLNKGFKAYGSSPVFQKDFDPAYTLAFDGNGDLLVGGGETWSLYERTAGGVLRFIQEDRAQGGYYAAMASAPDGSVVIAGGAHGLSRFHASGLITTDSAAGMSTLLSPPSHFTVGEGVAVAPNGSIYLAADANNGFTNVSAIVQVTTTGHAILVWKS
jgi:hypothetical protein